ncbi:MAG: ATP-binding protein [Pirellulaceae bacterium]|nr:ATP-binding protein [Pirellulaceae bacterium]
MPIGTLLYVLLLDGRSDRVVEPSSLQLPSALLRRRFFDIQSWMTTPLAHWNQLAAHSRIRIDTIEPDALVKVWSSPELIFAILDHLVTAAIDTGVDGDRIEVEFCLADKRRDWLTFFVRDWSGGRDQDWCIEPQILEIARHLGGHIDVSNHVGRSTVCSLTLPTGKLPSWISRQSADLSLNHISWSPKVLDEALEGAIHASLLAFGSIAPLSSCALLFATASTMDCDSLKVAIKQRLPKSNGHSHSQRCDSLCFDCLGSVSDFVNKIQLALTDGIASSTDSKQACFADEPRTVRVDSACMTSHANRIRPRRVGVNRG